MPPPVLEFRPAVTRPPRPERAASPAKGTAGARRRALAQILLDNGSVDPGDLIRAIALRAREEASLAEILLGRGWVEEGALLAALAEEWRARPVDLAACPPDPGLIDLIGAGTCLTHRVIPWRRLGGATVIATARPERFAGLAAGLPEDLGPYVMAIASEADILSAVTATRRSGLARAAEARVPAAESCRTLDPRRAAILVTSAVACLVAAALAAPVAVYRLLAAIAVASLVLSSGLKLAALLARVRGSRPPAGPPRSGLAARLPVVSLMIPLFREADIARRLVARLAAIDYPKELLDVLLVVEEDDRLTQAALAAARLPRWMRVVEVPDSPLRTKPRALNYALGFCRGSIIGVYDAEDRPARDQIHAVVRRFAQAPPDVACLQGILDFYGARTSWLSRCFAIEYAAWFRAMLPGLARLGLVVPLGGTTLFLRRAILEEVGGWDAHNVTEDADLGLRLARRGYRTELIETVTLEEPNSRPLAWVRQRSRWLKGYAVTWAVHMRSPRRLWRDLGPRRFLGVQVLFLGTLLQFTLAPVLWSFWLLSFGIGLPAGAGALRAALPALGAIFVLAEAVNFAAALWALRRAGHRHLMRWVPTMILYFPLATVAAFKALVEAALRPFHWDKTAHGLVPEEAAEAAEATCGPTPREREQDPGRNGPAGPASLPAPAGQDPRAAEAGRMPPLLLLDPVPRFRRRAAFGAGGPPVAGAA